MIELIPAIDIIDGKCVRLTKGDYDQKKIYSESPAEVARRFEELGFERLHVVDLDGAKSHHIVNTQVLTDIAQATNLTIDFGGGRKDRCRHRDRVQQRSTHGDRWKHSCQQPAAVCLMA